MKTDWKQRLHEVLWGERELLGRYEHELRQAGRYLYALARDLMEGQISMRAMSLVYTTLLSVVPLLALAFSLFKGLGVHNSLEPVLAHFLAPLGPQGAELSKNIVGFVENIKVGVLGSLGVALLLYTVVSMIQKVESSFNFIWRVDIVRRLGQRLGEYFSVLLIGPFAVFLAVGMTATVMSSDFVAHLTKVEPLGLAIYVVGRLIPYAVIVALFTFMYSFVPNTRVRLRPAFGGGLLAGVLWQSASLGFATFVTNSPNYNAIYSGFAIVILLLIWLYVGWLILLIGCQLSYYLQYPERLTPTRIPPLLSGRASESLGLIVMALVGQRFLSGANPVSRDQLHRELTAVPEHIDRVVEILLYHGVLTEGGPDGRQLLPRRDLDTLTVGALWQLLREAFDGKSSRGRSGLAHEVQQLLDSAESGFASTHGSLTLREWIGGLKPPA